MFEECCKLCNYIKESTRVKLITTIHYSPLCKLTAIKNNFFIKSKLDRNLIDWLKDCLLCFRFHLFKKKESLKMEVAEYNTIAKCSDAIVSLSSSYLIIFQKLINPDFHKKLYAISNPIELVDNDVYEKKKQILYVGRLEYGMKRFDRMINIWAKIEKMFPDWSFVVIGDGPYRGYFENIVQKKVLKMFILKGFKIRKNIILRVQLFVCLLLLKVLVWCSLKPLNISVFLLHIIPLRHSLISLLMELMVMLFLLLKKNYLSKNYII